MQAVIKPSVLSGKIKIPTSKSDTHRALICAALVKNQSSILFNVDLNDDVECTIEALKSLGAQIEYKNHSIYIRGFNYEHKERLFFNAKDSGSTLRFLIPVFSFFSSKLEITGSEYLFSRPLTVYKDLLNEHMSLNKNNLVISKGFDKKNYLIDGSISSQFISGLLFMLPLKPHDTRIEVINAFVSKPYVLMTIKTLAKFNIKIELHDNIIFIKGKQKYKPCNYYLEGDYSSASYISTLGLFNKYIDCYYLNSNSFQADKEYVNIIKKMNGNIILSKRHLITQQSSLANIDDIDIKNCPDLGPLLIVLMIINTSTTHLKNTKCLALKESNRGFALKEELKKFAIDIDVEENDIYIHNNSKIKTPTQIISSHNDHRILMSLVVFALCSNIEITIDNIECVKKSYPNFFNDLIKLGANIIILAE